MTAWGRIKVHYVLAYAVLGAHTPYLSLYLADQGLSKSQIGWVIGMQGLAVLVAPVLVTWLADRWLSNRLLLAFCYLLGAATLWQLTRLSGFQPALGLSFLLSFCFTTMLPILDGLTFAENQRQMESGHAHEPYRRIRVWGTIGFMLPAFGMYYPLSTREADISWTILLGVVIACGGLLSVGCLPKAALRPQTPGNWPTWNALRTLGTRPVANLMIALLMYSLAVTNFYTFLGLYLPQLGYGPEWIGLVSNLGVGLEVLVLACSGPIIRTLGIRGVLLLGGASLVLRYSLLAAVPHLGVILFTQLFHGLSVLSLALVPPLYLNHKTDPGSRNSIQGFFWMLTSGVGRLIGSALGGYVAAIDLKLAFLVCAIVCAVSTLWIYFGFRDSQALAELREHA